MTERPDILCVVEQHVQLRRAGRELVGLCPLHSEKTPSFAVNPDKGLWHCHGCGEGGDVITFIEKMHGVGFKEALKLLGVEGEYKPDQEHIRRRNEARRIAEWAHELSIKIRERLLDTGSRAHLCRKVGRLANAGQKFLSEEEQRLGREWQILCDLDDDLQNPAIVVEGWGNRAEIDNFVGAL